MNTIMSGAVAVFLGLGVSLPSAALAEYKYERKYGSGQYNYDVSGHGTGGYVSGNVDTYGKSVEGYLTDEDGNEVRFEGEWTDYGVIEGQDENGNTIELEVD